MEMIKKWRRGKTTIKLFYRGNERLSYQLKEGNEIIFEGYDFRPSPLHCIDSIESVRTLLEFLTLQKGDVDDDYFKEYGETQWNWVNSPIADNLRLYLYDAENRRCSHER